MTFIKINYLTRKYIMKWFKSLAAAALLLPAVTMAAELPEALAGKKLALVRFISQGDFFQAYLSGVESQAEALGLELQIFDARQDAARQRDMLDQAILQGFDGILLQHGFTDSIKDKAAKAVEAGIKVVAFDVDAQHEAIPQIQQSDAQLARLALEQMVADNGAQLDIGYIYVPGFPPLERRDAVFGEYQQRYPELKEVARFGTVNNPIANSVADQAAAVLRANPTISVIFAPFDEFAKGAKIALEEAGLAQDVKIYSADISTADIQAMREPGSPWVATAGTNPAVMGEVSVRALAMLLAGENPGQKVLVPPTLITQQLLNEQDIQNMKQLGQKLPAFAHADVANPDWMVLPTR
ncbi:LacI family transcriptional regulator [Oceanisphaera psychrotolerans]|uniref:LacI family transcriptional regulator n=2 Tax=Oceanisphaera psychrotolerans TaxID=1414654 RepID=A0A1J4QF22_9GAMM|nr:LacI family transcriptional regulator [Oceanisphaera psychrotolerans]